MGIMIAAALIGAAVPVLSTFSVFQEGSDQLMQRFKDAGRNEGETAGFVDRYANTMVGPFSDLEDLPFFGHGLGLGTNAAAGMLRGEREFIGPEDEWGRLFFECGPVFGLILCLFRLALTLTIGKSAYDAFRDGNILPVLIFAAIAISDLNGQWGVPTSLGFAIFGSGLALAACVMPSEEHEHEGEELHEHAGDEADHSPAAEPAA